MEKAKIERVRPASAMPAKAPIQTTTEALPGQLDPSLAHDAQPANSGVASGAEMIAAMVDAKQQAKTTNLATLRAEHLRQRQEATRLASEEVNNRVALAISRHGDNWAAIHYDLATLALNSLSAVDDDPIGGYINRLVGVQALKRLQLDLFW